MKISTSRKALQYLMGILATAPLVSGILGLAGIYNPLYSYDIPADLILDSNLRFLNAMSIAVAISFYFILPVIEKETFGCRIICCAIFFGGVGRLISLVNLGIPAPSLLIVLAFELTFPIVIIYWQKQLASKVENDPS